MTPLRMVWSRLRSTLFRRHADVDLQQDIDAHLDLLAAEHERRGLSPAAARAAARRDFGGVCHTREAYRDARGFQWLDEITRDLHYAARTLRRSPGFAIIAVLSLAIGIGANATVFSLVNAIALRPLPVADPDGLASFTSAGPSGTPGESFSYPLYEQFRDAATTLSGVAAGGSVTSVQMAAESSASPATEAVLPERVSGNYFTVLGVPAALGRTFTAEDDVRGRANPVVVLSHAFWTRRFARDPGVVGRTITLARVPFTIIGVAPAGFSGFMVGENPDLWWTMHAIELTAPTNTLLTQTGSSWLRLMGRLAPGASLDAASAEMDAVYQRDLTIRGEQRAARLGDQWREAERRAFFSERLRLRDGSTGTTELRQEFGSHLMILSAIAGLVLLVACANVANLLLARASGRHREIAVRLAIGAGRSRLIRQLLTESMLLASLGAVTALLVAGWSAELLLAYIPDDAAALDVGPDWRVLVFTLLVSVLTAILFGLAPALRATRLDLTGDLKQVGTTTSRPGLAWHKLLVSAQVALTIIVLVATGLFVRTLINLKSLDAGFNRENVTLFLLSGGAPDRSARVDLFERVLTRLDGLPGVRSSSLFNFGLLRDDNWTTGISVPGYEPAPEETLIVEGQEAGPRFFETMGIPVTLGRDLTRADANAPDARVAVVNQALVSRFFSNVNPIGQHFSMRSPSGRLSNPLEVVGVMKDTKYRSLREGTRPAFTVPFPHGTDRTSATFVVRTEVAQPGLPDTIRRVVRELDPGLQIGWFRTMDGVVDEAVAREAFMARLAIALGAMALLLATVGLYGILAYAVTRRTRELAIRAALGADRVAISTLVLRDALVLLALGVTVGLAVAGATGTLVESLLFNVGAFDLTSAVAAVAIMTGVGLLASYVPTRRASRVDPVVALRAD